jgi:adenine specific DNA methylase Mod
MDTWTTYHVIDGREVVASIERDSRDHGEPDVFETYETSEGETRISRKEEDANGDGTIDIISTYENGKLVQRAISDEALSPL